MESPCKDCPNRKIGCHSTCELYKQFTKYREEIRQKRAEYIKENNDYWGGRKSRW